MQRSFPATHTHSMRQTPDRRSTLPPPPPQHISSFTHHPLLARLHLDCVRCTQNRSSNNPKLTHSLVRPFYSISTPNAQPPIQPPTTTPKPPDIHARNRGATSAAAAKRFSFGIALPRRRLRSWPNADIYIYIQ